MAAMRPLRLPALPLAAVVLLASCTEPDPSQYRDKLRYYLSDKCSAQGMRVKLTDDDNRSRPPTKYTGAAAGVAYTIRHNMTGADGKPVTMVTWVYKDQKAMEAAKA